MAATTANSPSPTSSVTAKSNGPLLCPSAPAEPGALLLGALSPDGQIEFFNQELRVDQAFLERASENGIPEQRFRFGNTCRQSGCGQWTGSRCGIIDQFLTNLPMYATPEELVMISNSSLPECSIRSTCRWFAQEGKSACHACPHVITNTINHPGIA